MSELTDTIANGPPPRKAPQEPRRPVGRPPLPESQRKKKYPVWLNEHEHNAIVAGALEVDESFGAYVRGAALRRAKTHFQPPVDPDEG